MYKKYLLLTFPIVLFLIVGLTIKVKPFSVLEDDNYYFSTFTDAGIDGGKSEILSTQKDSISKAIYFELKEGFISPYAGVSFSAKGKAWDLSAYDQVQVEVELENTKNLEMTIATYQNGITKENDPLTFRHNGTEIPISDNTSQYVLLFNNMQIEQWWLERFKLRSSELGPANWAKTQTVSLIAKIRLDNEKRQVLKVNSLVFSKDRTWFYVVSSSLTFLWYVALMIYFRIEKKKKAPVVITYQQTEVRAVDENNGNQILDYIATHYTYPDLSLLTISTALKVSEKQISAHIKKQFNQSFKEYLNGIRITEAKRLLQVTDKNVSEIAYQVGFNSPNHFNRTFKAVEGCTPTDFRKPV